jgi:hypothetical protein
MSHQKIQENFSFSTRQADQARQNDFKKHCYDSHSQKAESGKSLQNFMPLLLTALIQMALSSFEAKNDSEKEHCTTCNNSKDENTTNLHVRRETTIETKEVSLEFTSGDIHDSGDDSTKRTQNRYNPLPIDTYDDKSVSHLGDTLSLEEQIKADDLSNDRVNNREKAA